MYNSIINDVYSTLQSTDYPPVKCGAICPLARVLGADKNLQSVCLVLFDVYCCLTLVSNRCVLCTLSAVHLLRQTVADWLWLPTAAMC